LVKSKIKRSPRLAFFIGIMRSFLNPQAKVEAQEAVIGIAFFKPGFDKYRAYKSIAPGLIIGMAGYPSKFVIVAAAFGVSDFI
jgi:hypothetical protein